MVEDTLHLNLKNHPTLMTILKYRDHPSIVTIKCFRYQTVPFHFLHIDKKAVLKIIRSLSNNKASQETDLPVRVVKENAECFAEIICSEFNESINSSKFSLSFKLTNITPVFKNESRNHKNNYRPASILPLVSKVFEKIMNKQLSIYFEEILSKFQCGFRKYFSTQHCLLLMLEKWKRAVGNNKVFAALITNLSKAFDCISHDLLIAKLNAYGLSLSALKLVHSYLQNHKQGTKIGSSYSLWEEIVSVVPQGSILGPLLFNIFLCDLFLSIENKYFTNYADDTTPYVIGNNPDEVVSELKDITEKLFTWFSQNEMKANLGKCHMLLSSTESLNFQISDKVIHNSQSKKLLGVTFDNKLKFEKHINTICQKANRKLNALARTTPYMELTKRRILMNAFFDSQFNYCLLIWMFHSRNLNNNINRLHERCFQVIYNDKTSSFEQLLENDNSVSMHHRNIQTLAIEMYKVTNGLSPEIMNELFQIREESRYNLRYTSQFTIPPIHSVYNGRESVSFMGPKIWRLIPPAFKQIKSLSGFKKAIKEWKPSNYPCRLCKTYISQVGFL